MIINRIAFGDDSEAFVENRLSSGFNIIYSDDNNKGKTIVMQSALYALGNESIFPSSFNYKDYYHYVMITLDDGCVLESCRKGNSFVVKIKDNISILDSVAELKRFLNRNGFSFPVIVKDNAEKMVDPVLLYQLFFVGQDKKNSSTIFNDLYYKKDDFWNLIYAIAGFSSTIDSDIDEDEIKQRITMLTDEKKILISKNKVLNSSSPVVGLLSQKNGNDAFEAKKKKVDSLRDEIIELSKRRNRALNRKVINEKTLKEIRALNRTTDSGSLECLDCGSKHIGYSSGDKSYTFDITNVDMRNNIIFSIQDKIASYQEEIDTCTTKINELQKRLQELLKEDDITLESMLIYKNDIVEASNADKRLVEIDSEIKSYKAALKTKKGQTEFAKKQIEELRKNIIGFMNAFYKEVDPTGSLIFSDLFSKRNSVYSGCEETEFYLSKLYAIAKVLNHSFPLMMDYFRDGELSTEKETVVLDLFSKFSNQIVFTATLKQEELGKYKDDERINAIDYSNNETSHILSDSFSKEFKGILSSLMIDI